MTKQEKQILARASGIQNENLGQPRTVRDNFKSNNNSNGIFDGWMVASLICLKVT